MGKLESEGKEISISTGFKCARHKGQDQENLPSSLQRSNVGGEKQILSLVEIFLEEWCAGEW